jgi:uncharacterized membrane protein HdeD (DUF308 family)
LQLSESEKREKLKKVVSAGRHRVSDKLNDLWWWLMIRGVLALGLAVFALFWPQKTVGLLVNLLGAYLLLDGLMGVLGAFRSGEKGGASIVAIVGLVVGAVLIFWTGLSVKLFLILVGVWAIIQGGGMFLSSRNKEADLESRNLVRIMSGILAIAGLILVVWPNTGIVTVSWLLAGIAFVLGCVMV